MGKPETFHFMCCDAHDQRLAGSNLMVADPASVLFQHPDTILLRWVDAFHAPAFQPLHIQVGKCLVRAVIFRSNEAVELPVIHGRQTLLELWRLFLQPLSKAVTDFVNLRVGELDALAVACLDVVSVLVLADLLHHVGAGVVQGVFQQAHAVIVPVIALYTELLPYFHVLVGTCHRKLVKARRIGDFHFRVKQMAHVGGIDACRNPSLAEIEVQFLKTDTLRRGGFQGFKRLFCIRKPLMSGMVVYPFFHTLRLLYHVSGNESVLYLIARNKRVVIDTSLQGSEQFLFRTVGYGTHEVEVYAAISVERGGQGFFG